MSLLFDRDEMHRSAEISPCGAYRYSLGRCWEQTSPVNFVMLNPSTADADIDDPTIRRCIGFAKAWGYGSIVVTNLFAFRATDPADMAKAADPIGPENDRRIVECAMASALVVCAWGAHRTIARRAATVLGLIRESDKTPMVLRTTKDGHPCHPLYLPADLSPVEWRSYR